MSSYVLRTDEEKEKSRQENSFKGGASWFLMIFGFSVMNMVFVFFHKGSYVPIGLGLNEWILGFVLGYQGITMADLTGFHFVLMLLFPMLFLFIWIKRKNKKVYLTGMIIYGIDTLFSLFSLFLVKYWIGFALHLSVLLMLYGGYRALKKYLFTENTYKIETS